MGFNFLHSADLEATNHSATEFWFGTVQIWPILGTLHFWLVGLLTVSVAKNKLVGVQVSSHCYSVSMTNRCIHNLSMIHFPFLCC